MERIDLKSLLPEELEAYLVSIGEPKFRAKQLFSWLGKGAASFDEMRNLPQSLRDRLRENAVLTGLKLLNKQDVADPVQTQAWLDWYNAQPETRAIAMDAEEVAPARRLVETCRQLAPNRGGMAKPMRVLICGVPNVGKSTLINTMTGAEEDAISITFTLRPSMER